jgi:hypothetical protein
MSLKAKVIFEVEELKSIADKGYYSSNDLVECEANHIETYVAKQRRTGNVETGGRFSCFHP